MSTQLTLNDAGHLIRIKDDGVEPVTVAGTPVRPGHTYCNRCGLEYPDGYDKEVWDHFMQEHVKGEPWDSSNGG